MGPWMTMLAMAWAEPGTLTAPDAVPAEEGGAAEGVGVTEQAADDAEAPAGPVLAVPVGHEEDASTIDDVLPVPRRSLAVPGGRKVTAEQAQALRRYRREHLSVRGYQETYVGTTTVGSG